MDRSSRTYAHLEGEESIRRGDAHQQDAGRMPGEWRWRVPAFLAGWLLFVGFLALQPLTQTEPKLRVDRGGLIGLTVAFLGIGVALSGIAFAVCRSWRDRLDLICLPCLTSCFLGLLVLLFSFAVSARYDLGKPAGTGGAVVALLFSIAYLIGTIYSYHRLLPHGLQDHPRVSLRSLFTSPKNSTAEDTGPKSNFPGEAPVHIVSRNAPSEDEENTRRHMAGLMSRGADSTSKARNSQGSSGERERDFNHLEWPEGTTYRSDYTITPAVARASAVPPSSSGRAPGSDTTLYGSSRHGTATQDFTQGNQQDFQQGFQQGPQWGEDDYYSWRPGDTYRVSPPNHAAALAAGNATYVPPRGDEKRRYSFEGGS